MKSQDQYIQVGSVKTHYVEAGIGEPLILLHGVGRSLEDWSENILPLAQHHRVIALDLVGYGRSDKPAMKYSVGYLVDFVGQFMDALGLTTASLMGNSMGGAVSLQFALAYPLRVSRLVLVAPAGCGKKISPLLTTCTVPLLGEWLTQPKPNDSSGQLAVLKACFHNEQFITEERLELGHQLSLLPGRQHAFLSTMRNACTWLGASAVFLGATLDRLGEIQQPSLTIWGQQDQILPAQYAQNTKRIPNNQVRVWDNCGHFPQIEMSERFNETVLEFLLN